ncbi:MAG: hypothetical protein GY791_12620 [Alphaproteobacteria bacterium]|nr:hypothetical protein [Alphaproteobacteria bacterium]
MQEMVKLSVSATVSGGPEISASRAIAVDAYDSIKVVVDAAVADLEVEVQPGGSGQVKFISITSTVYGSDLTYRVNNAAGAPVALDAPQVFGGEGAVGLLDPAPASLFFSNSMDRDATVQIFVGRDATPSP